MIDARNGRPDQEKIGLIRSGDHQVFERLFHKRYEDLWRFALGFVDYLQVAEAEYADVLKNMRGRLRQRMRSLPDLGLFPESYLLDHAVQDPLSFAKQNTTRITQLLNVADLSLLPFGEARADLKVALEADDPWKRYWALIVCSVFGEEAAEFESRARALTSDKNVPVRVRAAEFLGVLGAEGPMSILYGAVGAATNEADALLALNTTTYLRDHLGYDVDADRIEPDIESRQIDFRIKHLSRAP